MYVLMTIAQQSKLALCRSLTPTVLFAPRTHPPLPSDLSTSVTASIPSPTSPCPSHTCSCFTTTDKTSQTVSILQWRRRSRCQSEVATPAICRGPPRQSANGRMAPGRVISAARYGRSAAKSSLPDEAIVHPNLPYLHIIHQLPQASSLPFPPTEESASQLIDILAPALMKSLDLAIDAIRRGGGKKNGGWNLLMSLYVPAKELLTRAGNISI